MRALALVVLLALAPGCIYHLRVDSKPVGAVMTVDDQTYVLPTDLHIRWKAFKGPKVEVSSPGYRTLQFRLQRRHIHEIDFVTDILVSPREAFGDAPRRMLEVRLVPEHGPSGTWTEDQVNP